MAFADIPIRENGQKIDSSWWNIIRSMLITAFDSENLGQEEFVIADNQSTSQNITGLILNSAECISAVIRYEIFRKNEVPTELRELGYLSCIWNSTTNQWSLSRRIDAGVDALNRGDNGITIVAGTGQIQYQTDDMAGSTHEGYIRYKIITKFVD